ncbi:MAG: sigma-70 family RNA polymerase sigma factor [Bryobacterales bacterium]|nr:sigma-70 family RNA polymerase sigma factor [Bryobacterales bacterium]
MSESSPANSGLSPGAVARLVEGRRQFLTFLEKRIQSQAAAEDILQAAFVRSFEKGGSVRDEESVVAWFYRVLRNAVIDYYRQQGSAGRASEQLIAHLEDHQEPDDVFKGEICECVTALLDNVKPEYREALQAVDLNDGSLAELAAHAGITTNNAAVRVHRARAALREQVTTACGVCATHGCLDCHCKSRQESGSR